MPALVRFYHEADLPGVRAVLAALGWEECFVEGQLESLQRFLEDPDGARIFVASAGTEVLGFVTVQVSSWNRLGRLHGLAVGPDWRRRGVAAALVAAAEDFARGVGARGIYVDTPADNAPGRRFYGARGYTHDHTMTEYYGEGVDGVTYVKFFRDARAKRHPAP